MEETISSPLPPVPANSFTVCPQCHLPVRPEFYFCPNCGAKLHIPPLSTTIGMQIWIYLFSAVLPWIAYLAITKWQGMKYIRSSDPRARAIGYLALAILVLSSIIAIWLTTVWINQSISSAVSSVNNLGSFGGGGL